MILPYALAFIVTPIAAILGCIGLNYDRTKWRAYLTILAVVVFLCAYSYTPVNDPDLVRYFEYINECKDLTFLQVIEKFNDGLFVKNFFFWLAAKMNNPHLIPAITTCLVYTITGYITFNFAERKGLLKKAPTVFLWQILCLQYFSIVNNVRNVAAFALTALAMYLELIEGKRNIGVWMLYILPIFIHPAAITVIIARLLLMLPSKILLCSSLIILFFPELINYIYVSGITVHFGDLVSKYVTQLWRYINDPMTSQWSIIVSHSFVYKIQRIVMTILSLILFVLSLYYSKTDDKSDALFFKGTALLNLTTLASYPIITPQYWRFSTLSVIVGGGALISLMDSKNNKLRKNALLTVLWLMAAVLLVIQVKISQGIVEPLEYIVAIFVNNIYVVLIKLILGIGGLSV